MATKNQKHFAGDYQTITGGRLSLGSMSGAEIRFLELVASKYSSRQDWTRFAAWWNAQFTAAGLNTTSVVFRVCQDLEARLGIKQGKVAPPDYRDYLAEMIDTQFSSRQEFCKSTGVDPGQLSRVLAGRGDLSMKVLEQIFEVLNARIVVQTQELCDERTSIESADEALTTALSAHQQQSRSPRLPTPHSDPLAAGRG